MIKQGTIQLCDPIQTMKFFIPVSNEQLFIKFVDRLKALVSGVSGKTKSFLKKNSICPTKRKTVKFFDNPSDPVGFYESRA